MSTTFTEVERLELKKPMEMPLEVQHGEPF